MPVKKDTKSKSTQIPKPNPKTPFSGKDRVKQLKGVNKTRKNIMDELDKS